MITEVTFSKDIIIDNFNIVNPITIVIVFAIVNFIAIDVININGMLLTLLILKIFCKGEYFQLLILI